MENKGVIALRAEELMIQSVLRNWETTIMRLSTLFDGLSEAEFYQEIAPGRNRIIYVLGDQTALNDRVRQNHGFGTRDHPELDDVFIKNPDRVLEVNPSVADLKSFWEEVNRRLDNGMRSLIPEQWVARHRSVSDEDFAKDPTWSRLNVVLNRTNHAAYHLGQLMLWHAHKN